MFVLLIRRLHKLVLTSSGLRHLADALKCDDNT